MAAVIKSGGGQMWIPHGVYRGKVIIPDVGAFGNATNGWISIEIVGETPPVPAFGTVSAFPNIGGGTVITSAESTGPAVISVARSEKGAPGVI